ncbi:DUF6891 domain-containing protein [Demetria terragena]|uniref:DUF6891 domain-containing protein n=1 Tax=Demetria terragena TaxID=63959 RepID=UPI000372229B|nr:hypothetical protein [Demetria terragena]
MSSDRSIRGAYFEAHYPPDPTTFAGTVMTRVAVALDTRDALVEAFTPVAADMSTYFPGESDLTPAHVAHLVDSVIADHNDVVRHPSPDAIRLLDALDGFPTAGLAISFGAGRDAAEAVQTVMTTVGHSIELGADIKGYVFATANDAAELILEGQLRLTYGIFAESGIDLGEAAHRVREVLDRQGLPVLAHDDEAQQVLIGPLLYEVPYHGHRLHEYAEPEPDTDH